VVEPAEWVPNNVDVAVPSAARVYDYLLGGAHNFDVDRIVGKKVLQVQPNGRQIARSNRAFLTRAVRYLVDNGITQFLDLGSGIPTVGNVHEVAQRADPECRVVYVDYDAVAVAHSQLILQGNDHTAVVDADLTQPDQVLDEPRITQFLDFSKPIGLLLVAVFHFVPDEKKPHDIVARYRSALPSGSYVALSHLTADQMHEESAAVVEAMKNSRDPMFFRSYDEFSTLFDGLDLVEPGIVSAPRWRGDDDSDEAQDGVYVGLGKVR
jgi:S-adenosyl methyltransferase